MKLITTERLSIEPSVRTPMRKHLEKMIHWLNDPDLMAHSEQRHKAHTFHSQLVYIESFVPPSEFRSIYRGNDLVGTITANVDSPNLVADIGILIGETGLGYGTEAWSAMIDYLFSTGIRKIEAGCMKTNSPMREVFLKSGMFMEGLRVNHFMSGKYMVDMELWAKFAKDKAV